MEQYASEGCLLSGVAYDGSGESKFLSLNGMPGPSSACMPAEKLDVETVEEAVLRTIGYLMMDEVSGSKNYHNIGFGLCYEAAVYGPTGFYFVDDVLFMMSEIWMDDSGSFVRHIVSPCMISYATWSGFSIIQNIDMGVGGFLERKEGLSSKRNIFRNLVSP